MRTFRLIGMALLAVVMCVNFTSCSDDDEEEQGETFNIEGTWLLQSSKGYIENGNDKNTWDESYPDLQETKLEVTKWKIYFQRVLFSRWLKLMGE